ncbi:MAG: hypothetical protein ABI444_08920 [Candidatus Kapaibacterium sp.]|jgi:hypothetical protein
MRIKYFVVAIACLMAPSMASAQDLIDAMRLTTDLQPIGARGQIFGNATFGSIIGIDALSTNPAALAPLEFGEMGIAIFGRQHGSTALYNSVSTPESQTSTSISALGIAIPVETKRGHLAFGISYDLVQDYSSAYSFNSVNNSSSFLNTTDFLDDPGLAGISGSHQTYLDNHNLAWQLHLTLDVPDSGAGSLRTILKSGLQESGTVLQEGSMHAIRVGGGIDIAEGFSVGAALNFFVGSYTYSREFNVTNVLGLYGTTGADSLPPYGFKSAQIIDNRDQQIAGASMKFGVYSYLSDLVHVNATIETPTIFSVADHFHESGTSKFVSYNFNSADAPQVEPDISNNYDVVTPLKFGLGATFQLLGATVTGGMNYADMSQTRFTNGDVDLSDLNLAARKELTSVLSWQLGAEYLFKVIGVSVRAGYGMEPSPYKNDPTEFNKKMLSFGASMVVSKSVIIEGAFKQIKFRTQHTLYPIQSDQPAAVISPDDIVQSQIVVSLGYRF